MFLEGYARFLSSARLKKDDSDYKFEDFEVSNYQSHPAIKGEVAV